MPHPGGVPLDIETETMTTANVFDRARLSRAPQVRSLRLGELTVTYVPDGLVRLKQPWLPAADWAANRDHLDADGFLVAGIGGLLIERDDRALLIDAGLGPETHPDNPADPVHGPLYGGALLDELRRLGRTPDRIEAVAVTHLHIDHLGWTWHTEPGAEAGNNAAATYFVQLATEVGFAAATAGTLLTVGAILAVAVRLAAGAAADRAPRSVVTTVAVMMALGGAGLALIALGSPASFLIGTALVFTAGWGWTGLLLTTALRLVPDHAETAGHTVQVGVFTGATVAPYAFGALTSTLGFAEAALAAAAAAMTAAVLIPLGAALANRQAKPADPAEDMAERGCASPG